MVYTWVMVSSRNLQEFRLVDDVLQNTNDIIPREIQTGPDCNKATDYEYNELVAMCSSERELSLERVLVVCGVMKFRAESVMRGAGRRICLVPCIRDGK